MSSGSYRLNLPAKMTASIFMRRISFGFFLTEVITENLALQGGDEKA